MLYVFLNQCTYYGNDFNYKILVSYTFNQKQSTKSKTKNTSIYQMVKNVTGNTINDASN